MKNSLGYNQIRGPTSYNAILLGDDPNSLLQLPFISFLRIPETSKQQQQQMRQHAIFYSAYLIGQVTLSHKDVK